jgi:membrane carboxypeptidase/penicillin-binding protein PbpC
MDDPSVDYQPALETGESAASLLDMTGAYGILANGGRMVGVALNAPIAHAPQGLEPVFILSAQDYDGHGLPLDQTQGRSVVSPQLAFILDDVLSDDTARWPAYGPSSVMEIGQPAGAVAGSPPDGHDNWAVGFTPRRVVGAWVGNRTPTALNAINALNGAAPIWHAVLQYASRELPSAGWTAPAGVNTLQVCDPSGLLPTTYCPELVREVFVQGTEPTHYDTLYQPFRVNKETGKLATLFTPLDLVQEKVYLVPPPEASAWARQAGIPQPPTEYDTIVDKPAPNPDVNLTRPTMFAYVHGVVSLQGSARPKGLQYFRLQFGAGLNPTRWTQIGSDLQQAVSSSELGKWDTQGLNGLYTLQLVAVLDQGQVMTDATPVTVDNSPPSISLVLPSPGQAFVPQDQVVIQADVSDNLALDRVEFYVDFRQIAVASGPPYSARWQPGSPGEHTILARAYDLAGNMAESQKVAITIGK